VPTALPALPPLGILLATSWKENTRGSHFALRIWTDRILAADVAAEPPEITDPAWQALERRAAALRPTADEVKWQQCRGSSIERSDPPGQVREAADFLLGRWRPRPRRPPARTLLRLRRRAPCGPAQRPTSHSPRRRDDGPFALNTNRVPDDAGGKFFKAVLRKQDWPQGLWVFRPREKSWRFIISKARPAKLCGRSAALGSGNSRGHLGRFDGLPVRSNRERSKRPIRSNIAAAAASPTATCA